MKVLQTRFENYNNALNAFDRAVATYRRLVPTVDGDQVANNLLLAGVIQHFEIAYEMLRQLLSKYVAVIYRVRVSSTKELFRLLCAHNIITEPMMDELNNVSDVCNRTNDMYNHILAQEIFNEVMKHKDVMKHVLNRIKIGTPNGTLI
jgi:uncharacterized protein YutE (UPF0331/DUF86 family)